MKICFLLKGKKPVFSEEERLYIVKSIRYVHDAFLGSGIGMLDFEPDLNRIKPDIFIVNHDGHTSDKEKLCKKLGIEYIVLGTNSGARIACTFQFRNKEGTEISLQALSGRRMD